MITKVKNKLELKVPEYGRNIQEMVNHMLTIKDKDNRTTAAFTIIDIMRNMSKSNIKDANEYQKKLWNDLMIMADYQLDINDVPVEILQKKHTIMPIEKLPYPTTQTKHSHYGSVVLKFIQKIIQMKEGDDKKELIIHIANYMKRSLVLCYKKDVNKYSIFEDLKKLSQGKIVVDPNVSLQDFKHLLQSNKRYRGKKGGKKYDRLGVMEGFFPSAIKSLTLQKILNNNFSAESEVLCK